MIIRHGNMHTDTYLKVIIYSVRTPLSCRGGFHVTVAAVRPWGLTSRFSTGEGGACFVCIV